MRKTVLLILMLSGVFFVKAQEEEGYTDEDLTKYATVMVWAENEQGSLSTTLVDRIKSDTIVSSKYNDLKGAYGDEAKLKEIGATDVEVVAYEAILAYEDSIKASFKEVYVDKIKNDIGVSLYNGLKKDLKADQEVNVRYEAIYTTLLEESATAEENSEEQEEDSEK